jgi:hypothetical protein
MLRSGLLPVQTLPQIRMQQTGKMIHYKWAAVIHCTTALKNAGFLEIDSFNRPRAFNFIYKKQDASFIPVYQLSAVF